MFSRVLAFLTDLILFLLVYCFLFVSIVILLFDRNTDYSRFMPAFYLLLGVCAYLYFILPLFLFGKTLGKRFFGISILNRTGWKNIVRIHVKYIVFRLFPMCSIIMILNGYHIVVQIVLGVIILYPIFDYIYLKATETTFTDSILQIDMKVY